MALLGPKDPNNKMLAIIAGEGGALTLYPNRVEHHVNRKLTAVFPLTDITDARVESGAQLESRVTATRLLAVGVFALAMKKKTGGESFVTIESEEILASVMVGRKKANDAMKFVARVKAQRKA